MLQIGIVKKVNLAFLPSTIWLFAVDNPLISHPSIVKNPS